MKITAMYVILAITIHQTIYAAITMTAVMTAAATAVIRVRHIDHRVPADLSLDKHLK